jgi:hypothetical protein
MMTGQLLLKKFGMETKMADHYHITAVCSNLNVPEVIVSDMNSAVSEWAKMILLVHHQTGAVANCYSGQKATFNDGTIVSWRKCDRTCFS